MNIEKCSSLVPRLRFPEFRDVGEWVTRKLQDLLVLNYGMSLPAKIRVPGEFPVYGSNGIVGTHNEAFVSEQGIVIGRKGSAGHVHLTPGAFCPIDTTFYLTINDVLEVEFHFLYFLLKHLGLRGIKDLGSVPGLNRKIAYMTTAFLPLSRREQQKIADCLGSLDDLMSAQEKKLESLRQHKQGLMQNLFPQPGETVPRLRFPEFRSLPGWGFHMLSSVSEVNPKNDGLPERFSYIDLESVRDGKLYGSIEIDRDSAPSRAQRLLSRKDIIYQTVRPYQRNNLFFNIGDGGDYVASTGYVQLRAHESAEFLYQFLHTDSFVSSVLARCTGSSYPAINHSELSSIRVLLPRKAEQQKIADCLGSLDDLISAQEQKLETLQQQKQGLMQQLFATPEYS